MEKKVKEFYPGDVVKLELFPGCEVNHIWEHNNKIGRIIKKKEDKPDIVYQVDFLPGEWLYDDELELVHEFWKNFIDYDNPQ